MGGKAMFVLGFGVLHLILTVMFWAALVMLVAGLFSAPASIVAHDDSALGILNQRYARGEISKADYVAMRRDLES
jgi:uncharacterized membrane protein